MPQIDNGFSLKIQHLCASSKLIQMQGLTFLTHPLDERVVTCMIPTMDLEFRKA